MLNRDVGRGHQYLPKANSWAEGAAQTSWGKLTARDPLRSFFSSANCTLVSPILEELLETFSEEGEPKGLVAREVVHRLGLWHRASNVFLFRSDGRLVVQRRHISKDVCPGAWDLSVAEHLKPGESFSDGATRGLSEELGISGVSLEPIGEVIKTKLEIVERNVKDFEFQRSFKGVSDAVLRPQTSEVAGIRFFQLDDLKVAMLSNPEKFTPWFRSRAKEIGLFILPDKRVHRRPAVARR